MEKCKNGFAKIIINIFVGFFLCFQGMDAEAATECDVSCPSFSFIDTEGNVVNNESLQGKATILIFSTEYCVYSTSLINEIGRSDWFPHENVQFVFGLFDGTADSTKKFQNTYCYDGMTFCYTESSSTMSDSAFGCYHAVGGEGTAVSTPLLFLLDQNGNIRYMSEGKTTEETVATALNSFTSLDYSITDANIHIELTSTADRMYTGNEIQPAVKVTKGDYNLFLYEDEDYTVSYENNINAGTGYVVVNGMGYMKGTKKIPFTIQQLGIENASVSSIEDHTYTGNSVTPTVSVSCQGKKLTQGMDYSVSYINNIDPGTATVVITGIGNYTGTKVTTFNIKALPQVEEPETITNFTVNNQKYKVIDSKNKTVSYEGQEKTKKKAVTIPKEVNYNGTKYMVTNVAAKSFCNNKKITSVNIATSVTVIGDSAFEGCTKLKTVTTGKSLTKIGKNAFKNCKNLTKITIKSTKLKTVKKNALKGVNPRCKIKVPSKKVKRYQKLFKGKGQKKSVVITK